MGIRCESGAVPAAVSSNSASPHTGHCPPTGGWEGRTKPSKPEDLPAQNFNSELPGEGLRMNRLVSNSIYSQLLSRLLLRRRTNYLFKIQYNEKTITIIHVFHAVPDGIGYRCSPDHAGAYYQWRQI